MINERVDKLFTNILWAAVIIFVVIYCFAQYNNTMNKMLPIVTQQYNIDVTYSFNCADSHNDRLWSCKDGGFQNLTGQYCNGSMICQNTWRYK